MTGKNRSEKICRHRTTCFHMASVGNIEFTNRFLVDCILVVHLEPSVMQPATALNVCPKYLTDFRIQFPFGNQWGARFICAIVSGDCFAQLLRSFRTSQPICFLSRVTLLPLISQHCPAIFIAGLRLGYLRTVNETGGSVFLNDEEAKRIINVTNRALLPFSFHPSVSNFGMMDQWLPFLKTLTTSFFSIWQLDRGTIEPTRFTT